MKVITPVGASLFENYLKEGNGQVGSLYSKFRKMQDDGLEKPLSEEWEEWQPQIEVIRKKIQAWLRGRKNAAAEIYSLLKLHQRVNCPLQIYLLASETILSRLAVEMLLAELQQYQQFTSVNFDPQKDIIAGLQVANASDFKEQGMLNLMNRVNEIVGNSPKKAAINMTGGFKAVVPFLAIYGQLYDIPTYYIFENAEELIQIPQLPINFDFSLVEDYYTAFEDANKDEARNLKTRAEFLINLDNDPGEADKLLQDFINRQLFQTLEDEKIALTVYGKLLFNYFKRNYSRKIELESEKKPDSGNLVGEFMELKLYEFFMTTRTKDLEIYHSRKFGDYEADILIVNSLSGIVEVIECKSGGRIQFDNIREKKIKGLLPKVKEKYNGCEVHFLVYCYHHRNNWMHLKAKMKECADLAIKYGANRADWYWILGEKYSTQKISKNQINRIDLQEV